MLKTSSNLQCAKTHASIVKNHKYSQNKTTLENQNQKLEIYSLNRKLLSDLLTPVACLAKIRNAFQAPHSLLESVEGGEILGRYSNVHFNPAGKIICTETGLSFTALWPELEAYSLSDSQPNPFLALKSFLASFNPQNAPQAGIIGALSYDVVGFLETRVKQPIRKELPLGQFCLVGDCVVFDHLRNGLELVTHIFTQAGQRPSEKALAEAQARLDKIEQILAAPLDQSIASFLPVSVTDSSAPMSWTSNRTEANFLELVAKAKEEILAGEVFQLVISQRLETEISPELDSLTIYRTLRALNPSPYLFYLDFADFQLIGSSPEVMVKTVEREGKRFALLRPIAGTYGRGASPAEDQKLAEDLLADPKERAEHLMLVDLARNDLGRVCKAGSLRLTESFKVEKYSHVLHLVSEVEGELVEGLGAVDLLAAVFPAGTLSGAPKVRAMELIAELEAEGRGFYAGCVGFFDFSGDLNTAMTIRTIVRRGNTLELQAGAGIVHDSVPESEYRETLRKGAAIFQAIASCS